MHGNYSAAELFQITLQAMIIKQNRELLDRLETLENKLLTVRIKKFLKAVKGKVFK
jgi:hypothetical protein